MLTRTLSTFLFIILVSLSLWGWILYRGRTWSQSGQRAILVLHPATSEIVTPMSLAVGNPQKDSILLLSLPPELMFRASHNRELYPVNTLPRIAQIEGWSERRWLRELSLQLGVIIDGTISVSAPPENFTVEGLVRESGSALWSGRKSSLVWWDRLTWWREIRSTSLLNRELLRFDPEWLSAEKEINQAYFDKVARLRLQDDILRRSQWAVRVVNASGVTGDAGRQARLLELVGFNVLTVDTQDSRPQSAIHLDQHLADEMNLSEEDRWAVSRIQLLYQDWEQEYLPDLTAQKRVEVEVLRGLDLPVESK